MKVIKDDKILLDQKGNALVLVLIATIGLVALSYFVMQNKRNLGALAFREKGDQDIDRALTTIGSLILSPASCNANFFNQPTAGGSLAQIYKCNSGNCRTGTIDRSVALKMGDWDLFNTGASASSKVQLTSATYAITTAQTTASTDSTGAAHPAVLTLTLTFTRNLGIVNGVRKTNVLKPYTLQATVVTNTFNNTTKTLNATSANIIGCAQNPASTIEY